VLLKDIRDDIHNINDKYGNKVKAVLTLLYESVGAIKKNKNISKLKEHYMVYLLATLY
jgi:hypothetical protein